MKVRYLFWKKFGAGVLITFSILTIAVIYIPSAEAANEHEIVLDFSFEEPIITEINVSNTTYHKVVMNGSQTFGGFGVPLLPAKPMKILLPQKGVLKSISIDFSGNTSFGEGYNVILWSESENFSEGQNESNETYFNATLPFPEELYDNFGISNFRGYAILLVNLYPVHYIGDTGEIYYYENMSIKIKTEDTGNINPFFRGLSQDGKIMKQKVDDYSMKYTYATVPASPGNSSIVDPSKDFDMVIITREKFVDAKPPLWYNRNWCTFQDLANHKNSTGVNTTIVTIEDILECPEYHWNGIYGDNESLNESIFNDTQCHIRNFIKDAYLNWNISYVLLGGDTSDWIGREILPARYLWAHWKPFCMPPVPEIINLPSDLYYACLDGSFNDDNDKHYNASTPYSYWGTPLDGVGDFWEPIRQKNYYAEIDSSNYNYSFGVGLSTPRVDLSNYSSVEYYYINFTYDFEALAEDNVYGNFSIYSGGNNVSTSHHDQWIKLNKGKRFFNKRYSLNDVTDISKMYILFNYTDNTNSIKASFNVDNLSIEVDNEVVFEEGFEDPWVEDGNGNLAPPGWEQITYSQNEGKWIQENYWAGVDLDAEVYVGRAPVGNKKEVSNFVWKTIKYENLTSNDPCLAKVLLVGTILTYDESPDNCIFGGDSCDQLIDYYNSSGYNTTGIPNNTYNINKLYEKLWPDYWWPKNRLLKNLTGNLNFIHNDCHGTTCAIISKKYKAKLHPTVNKLGRFDAITLGNNKPFFLSSQSCLVGAFDNYYTNGLFELSQSPGFYPLFDCLGECLTVKTKQGAFAVRMNARYGIVGSNKSSQILDRLFFHEIFNDYVSNGSSVHELGRANQDSKYRVINRVKAQATPTNKIHHDCRVIFFGLNLLGDPSIVLKVPETDNSASSKPATPKISDNSGKWYTFYTNTSDPEGDKVSYKFKWDNHECLFWTKYYNSGENASKILWLPSGTHQVRVKSRDIFLNESDWSDNLTVTVSFDLNVDIVSSPVVLGEETQFYGQALQGAAEPVLTWNYTLGDGNYSDEQNTNITYGSVGTYNVTLTVTDNQSITSNVTKIVKVVILKSDINSSSDCGDFNESISFNDLSGGYYNISSWYWDFGDGNTSNNRNTSHAYASEGVYNVSLNVTDAESNYNVSYQTIYIDTGDPEIASASSDLNEVGYGYNVTITANLSDSVSGIKTAAVNVTYPDNTYGNFTMNNTNGSIYEYVFNDTCQLGGYSYKIWVVDNAENLDNTSFKSFTVLRSFGYRFVGGSNQSIWDTITGTKFKVNLKGVADNVSVYIDPGNATSDSHYQCVIYRHNDSNLMGISEEKNVTSGKGWKMFNFSVPKPVLINDTEYVLGCWADNYTVKMYYDDANDEEMFYDDGSSTLIGHYFEGVYNYTPDINNFEHEDRRYSIYCRYTPDNTTPEITNVSDTPGTVGFGFNVNITADVTDNASGVDTVKVNVTYPNNTTGNFTMNNTGNNTYEYIFSDTWLVGQHDYTIWTVDYAGNSNSSSGHSFNVSAQATISVCTVKDGYGDNEIINLTDPPGNQPIGYELLDDGDVLRIWNKYDSYYFNTSSGIQLTNHYDEYWSHNVLMLGYYNNEEWNLIYRTDELSGFNKDINSDNETYVNATLWKDLTYGGYDFRLAIRYHLGVDDNELTVIPYIKNLGEAIPYTLGFGWEMKNIQIDMTPEGDYIDVNRTMYLLNQTLDNTYTDLSEPEFYLMENITGTSTRSLYLRWNQSLTYKLQVKSRDGQYNAPVTLFVRIGTLNAGQEKHTRMYWYDADQVTYYFDSYDDVPFGEAWATNPSYMVDGNPSNPASTTSDGDVELCDGNTCPGNYLGIISQVEIRACGYYSGTKRDIFLRPVFGGTTDGMDYICEASCIGLAWSPWFDITNDPFVPQCWSWSYVDNLDCDVEVGPGALEFTLYCSKVEVRVTYTTNDPPEISDPYPPDGSTGVSISPVLNITVSDPDDDSMNIAWSSNSSGSWQVFGTNISVNNGTYHQTFSNATENGKWWYWKVNVTDGMNYTVSSVYKFYTGCQSKIKNTGSTYIKGYLLIQVQYYNNSSTWIIADDTINETTPRSIYIADGGNQLGLDTVFNGLVNTSNLSSYGNGTYRIYAAFRDPNSNILKCDDETELVATYEFTITFD